MISPQVLLAAVIREIETMIVAKQWQRIEIVRISADRIFFLPAKNHLKVSAYLTVHTLHKLFDIHLNNKDDLHIFLCFQQRIDSEKAPVKKAVGAEILPG